MGGRSCTVFALPGTAGPSAIVVVPVALTVGTLVVGLSTKVEILVVSPRFSGCSLLERQRLVNEAIEAQLQSGKVHSVQMRCWTPAQWEEKGRPQAFAARPCAEPSHRLGFGGSYEDFSSRPAADAQDSRAAADVEAPALFCSKATTDHGRDDQRMQKRRRDV